MSRLNVAELQRPTNGKDYEAPDLDIGADYGYQEQRLAPQEPKEDNSAEMNKHLKGIQETLQQSQQIGQQAMMINQLTQDADIQKVLQAKQQGKKLKIDEDDSDALPQIDDTEPNWEEIGQDPKKLSQHLVKTITGQTLKFLVPMMKNSVKQAIEPMNQLAAQVNQMGQFMKTMQQQQVNAEIDRVRQSNPHVFDQLRPQMAQLSGANPGLNTEDLFFLAKKNAGLLDQNGPSIQTERPTHNTAARPQAQAVNPVQQALLSQPGGRSLNPNAAFQQALSSITDKRFENFEIRP